MKRLILLLALLAAPLLAQNPLTAKFPGALAGDVDFGVACNSAHSTLTADIDASTLSIPVAAGAVFCSPAYVSIDYETMKVCSVSGNTLTVCDGGRAVHGSAASHSNGAAVDIWIDSNGFNQAAAEINAIETALGVNLGNVASPWLKSGSNIYFNAGAVGIGGTDPNINLWVRGATTGQNVIQQWGMGGGSGGYAAMFLLKTADVDGDFFFETYSAGGTADRPKIAFGVLNDPSLLMLDMVNWHVGVGTLAPLSKLTVLDDKNNVDGALRLAVDSYSSLNDYQAITWSGADAVVAGIKARVTAAGEMGFDFLLQANGAQHGLDQIANIMTLRGNGRLGIGTTDPAYALDVVGALRTARTTAANDGGDLRIGSGAYGWMIRTNWDVAGDFALWDASDNRRLYISNGGAVGIGAADPWTKLTVLDSSYQLALATPDYVLGSTGTVGQLRAMEQRLKIEALYNGGSIWGDVTLAESGGRVGIGKAAPQRQLHIYGSGQASANLADAGATGGTLYLQDSGGAPGNGGAILFGADQGSFAAIKADIWNGGENTIGGLRILTRRLTTDTVMVPALTVHNNGNVETNADFIADAGLYVNGNLYPGDNTTEENLSDWNTVMGTGIYQGADAAAVGQPEAGWYFLQNIRHTNLGSWWGAQIAYGWNGGTTNKIWYRTIDSGTPAAWWRIPVLPSLADAGRIKVQDVGCLSYYNTSCDANGDGIMDYAQNASNWTGARQFSFVYGGDPNVVIPATTVSNIWKPETIAGGTMTGVWCKTDAGTVTLEMMRSDGGVFASGTCSTTGSYPTVNADGYQWIPKSDGDWYGMSFRTSSVSGVHNLSVTVTYNPTY